MIDVPDNVMLAYLRRIDENVGDVADPKRRMTSLEQQQAHLHGDFAGQSLRIDQISSSDWSASSGTWISCLPDN